MAPLSDLSIGFIVGGSVIFTAIILGFVVWKIIDSKRRAKPKDANPRTGQSRVKTEAANVDVVNHVNGKDSTATGSAYTEIHVEDGHRRNIAITSTDSPTAQRQVIPTNDNTDDSGYCEGQLRIDRSEVYARLHEVNNPVQDDYIHVYNDYADEDSGQGSHLRRNSMSVNSDDEDANASSLVTPNRKRSANQTDRHGEETTPRNETEEDRDNYYSCSLPRVDIIEVRRSAIYEPVDEVGMNLHSVRDDTSNTSCDSDEVSVQDTPF